MSDENAAPGLLRSGAEDASLPRRYLLGQLTEEESKSYASRLFADERVYAEVLEAEADLLDDQARGQLTAEESAALSRRLLSTPEGKHRAAVAAALANRDKFAAAVKPGAARRPPHSTMLAIAACLVLGFSTLWLAVQNQQLRGRATTPTPQHPVAAPQTIASIVLGSEVTRGEESDTHAIIPGSVEAVKVSLRLNPGEPHAVYAAIVRKRSGETVWGVEPLRPAGSGADREVTLWIPAIVLPAGSYEIELLAIVGQRREPVGFYGVTVQRSEKL
jgi:hypothetical protein